MTKRDLFWLSRTLFAAIFVVGAVLLPVGCGESKPEEPAADTPPPPPPPSKEQLLGEMANAFKPISENVVRGGEMSMVQASLAATKQAISKVNGAKATNPNAEPALTAFKGIAEDTIRAAKERDRWRFLFGAIEVYSTLEPNNGKYKQLKELTDKMLAMPGVRLRGFTTVDTDLYAFLEIFDETKGIRDSAKVREGEEFYNSRFQLVRVIGNQESVEVLYKDADYSFTVQGPRLRNQSTGAREKAAE